MTKIESKTGTLNYSDEEIFNFISNFDNFNNLIPQDKIKNWQSTKETCTFTIDGLGETGLKIIEKEPFKTIKITGNGKTPFDFNFWVQLKQIAENDTKIKLTVKAEINQMMKMMIEKPLKQGLDGLIDQIEDFFKNKYK